MYDFGLEPVFPGYAGMVPAIAGEKLGLDVADPGKWCGYSKLPWGSPRTPHPLLTAPAEPPLKSTAPGRRCPVCLPLASWSGLHILSAFPVSIAQVWI